VVSVISELVVASKRNLAMILTSSWISVRSSLSKQSSLTMV